MISFAKTESQSRPSRVFKRVPRMPRGGLAWTLAVLAPLTTLALALITPWLVAPYLLVLGWLVFAPGFTSSRSLIPDEKGTSRNRSEPEVRPSATISAAVESLEPAGAAPETIPAPKSATRTRRSAGKVRSRANKPAADPVGVAWVKVGPNQFVRVERPGDAGTSNDQENTYPTVESTVEETARRADPDRPASREESPIEVFAEDSEAEISLTVAEPERPSDETIGDLPSPVVFEPADPLAIEEELAAGEPFPLEKIEIGRIVTEMEIEAETPSYPSNIAAESETETASPEDSTVPEATISLDDSPDGRIEAAEFEPRVEEADRAADDDRPALDARSVADPRDALETLATTDRPDRIDETTDLESETIEPGSEETEVEVAGNAPDTETIEPSEPCAIGSNEPESAETEPAEPALIAGRSTASRTIFGRFARSRSVGSRRAIGPPSLFGRSGAHGGVDRSRPIRSSATSSKRSGPSLRSRDRFRRRFPRFGFDRGPSYRYFPRAPPRGSRTGRKKPFLKDS